MNSSSPLPAAGTNDQAGPASPLSSTPPVAPQSTSTTAFKVVQTAQAGGTYSSTASVHLSNAPVAGDVLVLFFETNKTSAFPYSGQVTWPASSSGSQWSFDGSSNGTTILHHVVTSGETGSYTLNVGGSGSGWQDYVVAEVSGASSTNPVNARLARGVSAGTTSFTFGSAGIAPTAGGTFPLAFFSAHTGGLTWSSISSGWTIVDRNTDYTEMLAAGTVQAATTAVNATATLSSSNNYPGAADVVLLNPTGSVASPAPSAAPTSAPSAAPTTSPTKPPSSVGGLQYVYPNGGTPNCNVYSPGDWLTADLVDAGGANSYVPTAKDPGSDTLTSYLQSAYGNIAWYSTTEETANVVTSSTPAYPLDTARGHEVADLYGDSSNIPWADGTSLVEYQKHTCSNSADCHTNELNTSNCASYENYLWGNVSDMVSGGKFEGGNGRVLNLRHPYNDQYQHAGGGLISFGGIPMMGTTAWGEDLNYQQSSCQPNCYIPHVIGFFMPINGGSQQGYTAPAVQGNGSCGSYCGHTMRTGARFVLRAGFVCPSVSTNPQANLICNTLKKYGMVEDDTETNGCTVNQWGARGDCTYGLRMGTSRNGSNPWKGNGCCPGAAPPYTTANGQDLDDILLPNGSHYMHMTDFYVITGGVSS